MAVLFTTEFHVPSTASGIQQKVNKYVVGYYSRAKTTMEGTGLQIFCIVSEEIL